MFFLISPPYNQKLKRKSHAILKKKILKGNLMEIKPHMKEYRGREERKWEQASECRDFSSSLGPGAKHLRPSDRQAVVCSIMFYQPLRPCQSMVGMFQNIFNTQGEPFGSRKGIEQEIGEVGLGVGVGGGGALSGCVDHRRPLCFTSAASFRNRRVAVFFHVSLCVIWSVLQMPVACFWPEAQTKNPTEKIPKRSHREDEALSQCSGCAPSSGESARFHVVMGGRGVWNHNFTFEILESCSSSPWHGL